MNDRIGRAATVYEGGARCADVESRRRIADAWTDHIGSYTKLWDQAQCNAVLASVGPVAASETDPAISESLRTVRAGLASCPARR